MNIKNLKKTPEIIELVTECKNLRKALKEHIDDILNYINGSEKFLIEEASINADEEVEVIK